MGKEKQKDLPITQFFFEIWAKEKAASKETTFF